MTTSKRRSAGWRGLSVAACLLSSPILARADVYDALAIDTCAPNYDLDPGAYERDQYDFILRDRTLSYGNNGSCIASELAADASIFSFNGFRLSAIELPGKRRIDVAENDTNCFESRFGPAFMSPVDNELSFTRDFGANNWCAVVDDIVVLSGPTLDPREVFVVSNDGEGYEGTTRISLSLTDLAPDIAMDMAALEQTIRQERANLVADAGKIAAWDAERARSMDVYKQLDSELKALAKRPFDDITAAAAKSILDRYTEVSAETRKWLINLVKDLHKLAQDLKKDVNGLVSSLAKQADQVESLVTEQAIAAGFNPEAPGNYLSSGFELSLAPVEIPDLGATSPFDGSDDFYDRYATGVLEDLKSTLEGDRVVDKGAFAAIVRSWRANQAALQRTLSLRATVNALEMQAFLRAQDRVLTFIRNYLDADGWFNDAKVSPAARRYVDGAIRHYYPQIAAQIKEAMNQWRAHGSREQMLEDMTIGMGAVVSNGYEAENDDVKGVVERTLGWIGSAAIVGASFTPVGDVLDLCEAVTGRELCKVSGNELETWERVAAGLGVVIGSGKFWQAVGGAVPGVKGAANYVGTIITPAQKVLGRLTPIGPTKWRSSAGLIYGPDPKFGNRVKHVLAHTVPDSSKETHSVFNVKIDEVLSLVDEAWTKRGDGVVQSNKNILYRVAMGREVGTLREKFVEVIIKKGTRDEVVTAYPSL